MTLVLQLLELAIVVPLAVFGAALLVAGDRVRERATWLAYPSGWWLRPIGATYLALGAYVSWLTLTAGINWDAVLILYVVAAFSVFRLARRSRRSV